MSRHQCLFIYVSFCGFCSFYPVTLEYTISKDKCVPKKRDSELCYDELRSIVVLVLLYINQKKKKLNKNKNTWIGMCSIAVSYQCTVSSILTMLFRVTLYLSPVRTGEPF